MVQFSILVEPFACCSLESTSQRGLRVQCTTDPSKVLCFLITSLLFRHWHPRENQRQALTSWSLVLTCARHGAAWDPGLVTHLNSRNEWYGRVHAKNDEICSSQFDAGQTVGGSDNAANLKAFSLWELQLLAPRDGSQAELPLDAETFFFHYCVSDFHCDMGSLLIYFLQVDWKFMLTSSPVHQYFDSHQKHCFRFSMISILSGFVPQQHFSNLLILQVFAMARRLSSLACNDLLHVKSWNLSKSRRFQLEVLGFTGGHRWAPVGWPRGCPVLPGFGGMSPQVVKKSLKMPPWTSTVRKLGFFWTQGVKPRWFKKTTRKMFFFGGGI